MSNRAKEMQRALMNKQEWEAVPRQKIYWMIRTQAQIDRVFYPGFKIPYRYDMPPIPDLRFLKAYTLKP